jgi:hypothetical protein
MLSAGLLPGEEWGQLVALVLDVPFSARSARPLFEDSPTKRKCAGNGHRRISLLFVEDNKSRVIQDLA